MRLETSVGIYNEDLETMMKWFGFVKKPSKEDKRTYHMLELLLNDFRRVDKEDAND